MLEIKYPINNIQTSIRLAMRNIHEIYRRAIKNIRLRISKILYLLLEVTIPKLFKALIQHFTISRRPCKDAHGVSFYSYKGNSPKGLDF